MNPPGSDFRPGSLEEALAHGRQLLRHAPDQALRQAQLLLGGRADHPPSLRLAAAAHRALGEAEQAARAELTAIHHGGRNPRNRQAAEALARGHPEEAARLAAEQLAHEPDDLAAMTLAGEAALDLHDFARAEGLFRAVLERLPAFAPARRLLADLLYRRDQPRTGLQLLAPLLAARPDDGDALLLAARLHAQRGEWSEAEAHYARLTNLQPGSVGPWIDRGDALRFLGRKADSAAAYRRALAIDPLLGQAWWSLVNLDPAGLPQGDVEALTQAAARKDGKPDALHFEFALAEICDARGDHASAFAHAKAGNRLRLAHQPYDPDLLTSMVDAMLVDLDRLAFEEAAPAGQGAATPIFILGMPRSGSTLAERILAGHSAVEALGELPIMPHLVEELRRESPDLSVAALDPARVAALGEAYRTRAAEHRRCDRPFHTDKLHMNWRHLPLILAALPEARVIDIRRDALDCCWSNYKLLFAYGHPAASDLGHIARFYRDYARLCDALAVRAPDRLLALRYETLVEDAEAQARRMLAFVGLDFEPGCLDFHLSSAPVATASSEQVRRPLNRNGIGAWRPYAKWLGPLRDALGPLADA